VTAFCVFIMVVSDYRLPVAVEPVLDLNDESRYRPLTFAESQSQLNTVSEPRWWWGDIVCNHGRISV